MVMASGPKYSAAARPMLRARTPGRLALRPARTLLFDAVERRRAEMLTAATIAFTKYVVTDAAVRAVDRCLQITGAAALYRRLPLERMYRDVRAGPFHPPSNDRALEIIGREVLTR